MNKPRIAVLISGRGSNLQAVINACEANQLLATVVSVISNQPKVGGLDIAKKHHIESRVIRHVDFSDRETFDRALDNTLNEFAPDFVLLAGFMRILTPELVDKWLGKMINIHPSLLPRYPGLDTHSRALAAGDTESGASVHFVTPQLDGGPVILQGRVSIAADDTPETLASRVLTCEHVILPMALEWACSGRLELNNDACYLDRTRRTHPVIWQDGKLHFDDPVRSSESTPVNDSISAPGIINEPR